MARLDCDDAPSLCELLCHGADGDPYGDTFACATDLRRRAKGQLNNGWGDDVDVFRFRLRGWQTVEILTEGGVDTHGELYDSAGQRLTAVDEGGEGDNFRLVRTLGPGIYFVRVEGVAGSTGAYSLEVLKLDR